MGNRRKLRRGAGTDKERSGIARGQFMAATFKTHSGAAYITFGTLKARQDGLNVFKYVLNAPTIRTAVL